MSSQKPLKFKKKYGDTSWQLSLNLKELPQIQDDFVQAARRGRGWRMQHVIELLEKVDPEFHLDENAVFWGIKSAAVRDDQDMLRFMEEYVQQHDLLDETYQYAELSPYTLTPSVEVREGAFQDEGEELSFFDVVLVEAITHKNDELVLYALEKGADPHVMDEYPLRRACLNEAAHMVDLFLAFKPDLSVKEYGALRAAMKNGMDDYLDALFPKGKKIPEFVANDLIVSAIQYNSPVALQFVLEYAENIQRETLSFARHSAELSRYDDLLHMLDLYSAIMKDEDSLVPKKPPRPRR